MSLSFSSLFRVLFKTSLCFADPTLCKWCTIGTYDWKSLLSLTTVSTLSLPRILSFMTLEASGRDVRCCKIVRRLHRSSILTRSPSTLGIERRSQHGSPVPLRCSAGSRAFTRQPPRCWGLERKSNKQSRACGALDFDLVMFIALEL